MKHKRTLLRLFLGMLVVGLAISIFLLSSQPASQSSHLSMSLANQTLHIFERITGIDISLAEWNRILRKTAHFSLFFFLAVFIMVFCRICKYRWSTSALAALFISIAYAMFDEFHQLFVVGRGASWRDVGIDGAGAILGIILTYLLGRRFLK